MKQTKFFLNLLSRFKYIIVTVVGVLLVVFLDKNSMMKRISLNSDIKSLRNEIHKYTSEFKRDSAVVVKLKTDPKAIRDVARKKYYMKQHDEEIFVLSDEMPQTDE